jgi:hypothetical protein
MDECQPTQRAAECHCGALRADVSGDPRLVYVCHCALCQRRTGTLFHTAALFGRDQVRIDGKRAIYTRDGRGGRQLRFYFCPNCGSNVYIEADHSPAEYMILVGAFADPDFPAPTLSVFEESMHLWLEMPAGIERHPRGVLPD